MSTQMDSLAPFADFVGPANVLSAPDDIAPYAVDWRSVYRGTPDAVLRPGTTQEVAELVRRCSAAKPFEVFVSSAADGGPLQQPWYLTFGKNDPKNLEYDD